ncbi:MAG: helicase-associated domain-containing protein [bacterium]|nr:helicase-associated domain-containing protein [bacterium]
MAFHIPSDFLRALRHLATFQESQHQHLEIIYYLAAEGGSVPLAEMQTLLRGRGDEKPDDLLATLGKSDLIRLHRAVRPEEEEALPEGPELVSLVDHLEPLFRLPTFYRNRLRRKLAGRDPQELRRMADGFYAGSPQPAAEGCLDRAVLLASFKALLLDSDSFRRAVEEQLTWTGRVILKILSMHAEGLTLRDLRKQVGLFGIKVDSDELKRELITLFRSTGLVWTSDGSALLKHDQYFPAEGRILLVTDAVVMVRANFQLQEAPTQLVPAFAGRLSPEAWKVRHEPVQLFHNALILLIHLVNHRILRIQKGGMHKTEVKRVCSLFQPAQDDQHLFNFLFDFFEQHSIVQLQHEVWAVNVAATAAFFRQPAESLRLMMCDAFGADLLEKGRLEDSLGKAEGAGLDPLRLLWLLRQVSPAAWIGLEEIAYLYGQMEGGTRNDSQRAAIDKFVTHQLVKPLFWFGLVELSNHPEQGGLVFRLSGRGRRILQEGLPAEDLDTWFDPAEKLLVQANLEIWVPARFLPERTLFLARFADYERGRYRISAQSLSRGLDSGLDLEGIRSFLTANSAQAIPQNVSYLLEEVTSRHGHILVDPQLMVLKTEDARLMQELCLLPGLRKSWLALFEEQLLLLSPATRVQKMVEDLRRLGYMPRVRWEAVIDDHGEQLELSRTERLHLLAMLKAYEYADRVHPELAELLKLVGTQLTSEDHKEMAAIPQRRLGDSYARLDAMTTAIAAGRLD